MLENVSRTKLYSSLEANVTALDTVMTPTGIQIVLAANTTYALEGWLINQANGDGIKHQLVNSGVSSTPAGTLIWHDVVNSIWQASTIMGTPFEMAAADGACTVSGIIRTGPSVRLMVYYAKKTNVSDDTPLLAGSYLRATQLS